MDWCIPRLRSRQELLHICLRVSVKQLTNRHFVGADKYSSEPVPRTLGAVTVSLPTAIAGLLSFVLVKGAWW